ncbi:MAG TPA: hypothetical protein ENJ31_13350, partial [Anaerolineae bacterium]|nr:hypothetical protein [Anaerolineae bacterium]
ADVTDRMIFSILNEAVACLREGVIDTADHLDAGIIFGTGFAPFRGGPVHYIKAQDVTVMKQRLESLAQTYGERFTPDEGWQALR